jgi:choline/glycine/proline betaine transport protein
VALALFNFLEHFPFSSVLSFIAMAMVIVFVTSADSGAMVVDTLASGGVANTPVWQRIFWASLMGIVAIALLLAGGLCAANSDNSECIAFLSDLTDIHIRTFKSFAPGFDQA